MKQRIYLFVLVLGLVTCWAGSAHARFSYPDAPPYVRLSGVVLPLGSQDSAELRSLTVFIYGQLWRFRLDAAEEVTNGNHTQLHLRDFMWCSIRLYGSEDLLAPLQQPEITGKHLTIEGHLYSKERRLLVTAMEATPTVARAH